MFISIQPYLKKNSETDLSTRTDTLYVIFERQEGADELVGVTIEEAPVAFTTAEI